MQAIRESIQNRRSRHIPIVTAFLIGTVAWLCLVASTCTARGDDTVDFQRDVEPLVNKYCADCHGESEPEAGLSLVGFTDVDSLRAKSKHWESVMKMLRGGLMPPDDSLQPTVAERRKMAASIEALLFHVDCRLESDPGRVTIRRLNRNEYNNTVRDLLKVDLRPADEFPADDVGNGFDNIGDVLSLPPLLMEKYLLAAEALAIEAIEAPETVTAPKVRRSAKELTVKGSAANRGGQVQMISTANATAEFDIQRPGEYTLRVHAGGDQAGPDPARAEVLLGDKRLKVLDVFATRDRTRDYELPVTLAKGKINVTVKFINDYYNTDADDPKLRGDRNLLLDWIEIEGPAEIRPEDRPASHRHLLIARPDKEKSVRDAAFECLRPLVRRAFRREVSDAEVAPFVKLVESATAKDESFERGMQVATVGLLVSPQFLFRVERDPDPNDPAQTHELSQYELACRLSYFIWSSMPDDRLFDLAAEGKLQDEEVLLRETRRMVQDPRADELSNNFAGQWLNLRNLDNVSPDPEQFKPFDDQLRRDMKRETLLFFNAVMRENRSVLDFVEGDFTFVSQRLAKHYDMGEADQIPGDEFQRVTLEGKRKVGVLGHASILTLTSNPTRTSPVKRGKWIMDNILGTPPPEPPPNIPELEATQEASPDATLREQLELHRSTPSCAVCHTQMDALGFGLENFDAIGRWRDKEGGKPVDAAGELPGGAKFATPTELGKVLAGKREQICRNLAEKMMTYALGRGLQYFDRCAVDLIVARMEQNDYRFNELVEGIVLSDPFRKRRGERTQP